MKRFKFTLQTLLNVTAALEKEQKNKLANVNNQLRILNDKKEGLINKNEEIKSTYAKSQTLFDFIQSNNYIQYLKECIIDINYEISVKEYEKMKIQDELIETMTKRKTYEKLREKQLEIYKKELQVEESKALDDFISSNGGENKSNYG